MKAYILILALFFAFAFSAPQAMAQLEELATESAQTATVSATQDVTTEEHRQDLTKPEEPGKKGEILLQFANRPADTLTPVNFIPYFVQYSIKIGVPANTVVLILLLPFLATSIAAMRILIGLPIMEMLVSIILTVTLVATGLTIGIVLLAVIILSTLFSRLILKNARMMQLPKRSTSIFIVSIVVFIALTALAAYGVLAVQQISIFPILVFILLSDRIFALHAERNTIETIQVTAFTILFAVFGYLFLSSVRIQNFVLLYPEIVFILLPINFLLGRFFGLRATEYFRFSSLLKNADK